MGKLSKEILQLACDEDLVRNARALKAAIKAIEEEGIIPKGHNLLEELTHNLQVMEEEIEQRGLKEGEEGQGNFQGVEYKSESPRRRGSVDSHITRVSARISK